MPLVVMILVAVAAGVALFAGELSLPADIWEDRKNRNDRGKGKRPSDKYVC